MEDRPAPNPSEVNDTRSRLRAAVESIRESRTLDPEVRDPLADLLDELDRVLEESHAPPAAVTRLADSASHLAESLHARPDHGLLGRARDRLGDVVYQAEAHAPNAVGLARRVIDALAAAGI
jgi:hypothetical protein